MAQLKKIVISSGHGKYVQGAVGLLNEVDEARRVVTAVAEYLREVGYGVVEFHDDKSKNQSDNLDAIIDFHNSQVRDLDVSVHFNAFEPTDKAMGVEVLYLTQEDLARRVSQAIAEAGHLYNRGPKKRTELAFLNGTDMPSVLIEVAFVNSTVDAEQYLTNFDAICKAISLVGVRQMEDRRFIAHGKCSHFGGPNDTGVSASEGLAFIYDYDQAPHLFLPYQPDDTSGLARRLDPEVFYVACRWDYAATPKTMLDDKETKARVRVKNSAGEYLTFLAWPADWGPHSSTDRVADLSPGLMTALGITTDDEVEVIYPTP